MASQPLPGTNDRAGLLNTYRLDPYGASDGDLSFGLDPPSRPWKKVALAVTLLLIGSVMLFTGVGLFVTGQSNGESNHTPGSRARSSVRACHRKHRHGAWAACLLVLGKGVEQRPHHACTHAHARHACNSLQASP
jgi:hypothetical protein